MQTLHLAKPGTDNQLANTIRIAKHGGGITLWGASQRQGQGDWSELKE